MKRIFYTLSVLLFANWSFGQTVTKTHVVAKGETVTQIAKKYQTTNNVLFLLNPEAVNGISENQVLKIPTSSDVQHTVQPKETLYGISKQYNIAIEKLYDLNPGLKEYGLKIGQQLNLTDTNKATAINTNASTVMVERGHTIYSLAVQNNTTVSALYELNPGLQENGLKIGQVINLPGSKQNKNYPSVATNSNTTAKTIVVKPKETIYSITKVHNVSQEQLLQWNPDLANGLKEGTTLIIGYQDALNSAIATRTAPDNRPTNQQSNSKKGIDLTLPNNGSTLDLVMLLPFNVDRNNFNNPQINQNLKENTFLNMTLDYYSGAKLAIDQLKSKNYQLNVKFVDSKETNRALDVNTLKNDFDFTSTDVIIGPFFQRNVDAVSEAFKNQQTIIVSPLSTDKGKPYPRQVHTMPNNEIVRNEMLEYVLSKQARAVAITDGKKTTASFFNTNYPTITALTVKADEKVSATVLKNLLSENDVNYVIYDASSLNTSVDLVRTLRSLLRDYKIQLVSLEKLEVFDSSDIQIEDLTALKYTFPSVTNDAENSKKDKFVKAYRTVYGKNPNRFATRGYDVTYDVITRMFESDENSNIFDYGSQQVENKFAYINENGGVYNNAVYILYYDKDLTIKEAN